MWSTKNILKNSGEVNQVTKHFIFLTSSGIDWNHKLGHLFAIKVTGLATLEIDLDDREQFRYYFRMDLGLLAKVELGGGRTLAIAGEVLNVRNVLNVADYTWFQVPQVRGTPIRVPQVLTRRFFNLLFELQL